MTLRSCAQPFCVAIWERIPQPESGFWRRNSSKSGSAHTKTHGKTPRIWRFNPPQTDTVFCLKNAPDFRCTCGGKNPVFSRLCGQNYKRGLFWAGRIGACAVPGRLKCGQSMLGGVLNVVKMTGVDCVGMVDRLRWREGAVEKGRRRISRRCWMCWN